MSLSVSELAKMAGVSVRTLRHYDDLGLLRPSSRSGAGYRIYTQPDVERLRHILFFRALEFSLEEISRLLDDPNFDMRAALAAQRELLAQKAVRIHRLIDAIEAELDRIDEGDANQGKESFDMFKEFNHESFEDEARERWGQTHAYAEAQRRTARYGQKQWQQIKAEAQALYDRLANLRAQGFPPESQDAMDAAEAHRQHVERWFYPCPPAMHRGLGQLYVDDPRFAANIDRGRPGTAAFACKAFARNAERHRQEEA